VNWDIFLFWWEWEDKRTGTGWRVEAAARTATRDSWSSLTRSSDRPGSMTLSILL
jgi:hypothetical protein